MAFNPEKITKQHILDAEAKIENENIELRPSLKYDVIINNKAYPPKEIMRYAHELMNGEHIWERGGGEPTNKYLKALGFEIIRKVETYTESDLVSLFKKIGEQYTISFFDVAFELLKSLGIKSNDQRLTFGTSRNKKFSITIGQRYCLVLNTKEDYPFQFICEKKRQDDEFTHVSSFDGKPIAYYYRCNNIESYRENLSEIISASQIELNRTQVSGFRKYNNLNFENSIFDIKYRDKLFKKAFGQTKGISETISTLNNLKMFSKNIILYGPPGTGKTYNSIDIAIEIVLGKSLGSHSKNKDEFDRLRKEGQIEFVTFHQNYTYEDFIIGITPDITAGTLRFDKKEGIFKQLADRAKQNWLSSTDKKEKRIDFDYVFNSFFSKLIEEEINEVEIPMRSKRYKFKITAIDIEDGRIKFKKQSGGTGHDLLIKNVKGIYEGKLEYGEQGLGVYYNPLNEKLKKYAETIQPETDKVKLKNYVLVIDEINRANISKVFGELITLLEDDKRLGEANELKITLPNGEKDFGVPPNLYIIGTMNTADKSIALVDIALRRRFEFIGYYPQYERDDNEGYNEEAINLLRSINSSIFEKKKSADYLIGHAYFMKRQPIETVLENKVIPLLMEYFSGKVDIVSSIFDGSGWKVVYESKVYSWNISKV